MASKQKSRSGTVLFAKDPETDDGFVFYAPAPSHEKDEVSGRKRKTRTTGKGREGQTDLRIISTDSVDGLNNLAGLVRKISPGFDEWSKAARARRRAEEVEQTLSNFERSYNDGNYAAYFSALSYCIENKESPPQWVLALSQKFALNNLKGIRGIDGISVNAGATGNPFTRMVKNYVHQVRWDAVSVALEGRDRLRAEVTEFERRGLPVDKYSIAHLKAIGTSVDAACAYVSRLLEGPFGGSDETIKYSFRMVQKWHADPAAMPEFTYVNEQLACELGFPREDPYAQSKKLRELIASHL